MKHQKLYFNIFENYPERIELERETAESHCLVIKKHGKIVYCNSEFGKLRTINQIRIEQFIESRNGYYDYDSTRKEQLIQSCI